MTKEWLDFEDKYGDYKVLIVDKEWCFLKGNWAVINFSFFGSIPRQMGILNKLSELGYQFRFGSLWLKYFEKH